MGRWVKLLMSLCLCAAPQHALPIPWDIIYQRQAIPFFARENLPGNMLSENAFTTKACSIIPTQDTSSC